MSMKRVLGLAAVAVLLAGVSRVSRAETGVSDKEIVLGVCGVLSGVNKVNGVPYLDGVKAFFDYLNDEKGGVNQRKIRLIVADDAYDPAKAEDCYQGLLAQNVFALGFGVGGSTGSKYIKLAEFNKVPYVANRSGASLFHHPVKKYVFNVRSSFDDAANSIVENLLKIGARKIAVLYQSDVFGYDSLKAVQAALSKGGDSFSVAAAFSIKSQEEIAKAYASVKAEKPQAVVIASVTEPAAQILKLAAADGWKPIFVAMTDQDKQLIDKVGAAAEGLISANSLPIIAEQGLPTVKLYLKAAKKYTPDAEISAHGLAGFVDAMVFAKGLERAGRDLTREKFVASLEDMRDVDMGLGDAYRVHFSPQQHKAFDAIAFSTVKNGKSVALRDWSHLEVQK